MLRAGHTQKEAESLLQPPCHASLTPRNVDVQGMFLCQLYLYLKTCGHWSIQDGAAVLQCCSVAWVIFQPYFIFAELALPKV